MKVQEVVVVLFYREGASITTVCARCERHVDISSRAVEVGAIVRRRGWSY
jgi:transposase